MARRVICPACQRPQQPIEVAGQLRCGHGDCRAQMPPSLHLTAVAPEEAPAIAPGAIIRAEPSGPARLTACPACGAEVEYDGVNREWTCRGDEDHLPWSTTEVLLAAVVVNLLRIAEKFSA